MVRQGIKKVQRVSHYKGKQQDSPNLGRYLIEWQLLNKVWAVSSEKFEKVLEGYCYEPLNFINRS